METALPPTLVVRPSDAAELVERAHYPSTGPTRDGSLDGDDLASLTVETAQATAGRGSPRSR